MYLQEVVHHVGTPTEDEDENDDKRHLDSLHFGLGNEPARRGSPRLWFVSSHFIAGRRRCSRMAGHCFSFPPDGANNDDVAGADQDSGNEEECYGH